MKKTFLITLFLCFLLILCSCSESSENSTVPKKTNSGGSSQTEYKSIEVDLTSMSGTIAYSQVYDMIYNPLNYEGKVVKMKGPFNVFYSDETKLYYPAVIIKDATACCSQGIEFVLRGNPSYPSQYPKLNSEITVIGRFEVYYEGSNRFCHLINAEIV